jgi:hypothetical protein
VAGSYEHGNDPSGSHKMLGNFRVAERPASSQEGLCLLYGISLLSVINKAIQNVSVHCAVLHNRVYVHQEYSPN